MARTPSWAHHIKGSGSLHQGVCITHHITSHHITSHHITSHIKGSGSLKKIEVNMRIKTWQEHRTEMQREDRREWLQVVAISLGVIAAGVLLAYLVQ